mmetsp:Transcript_28510/g.90865  ORF Transcript_28510/g.90865 Transcript_28510/m.90865 type:complete len:291 (+) Transcript_28510:42-914(+)
MRKIVLGKRALHHMGCHPRRVHLLEPLERRDLRVGHVEHDHQLFAVPQVRAQVEDLLLLVIVQVEIEPADDNILGVDLHKDLDPLALFEQHRGVVRHESFRVRAHAMVLLARDAGEHLHVVGGEGLEFRFATFRDLLVCCGHLGTQPLDITLQHVVLVVLPTQLQQRLLFRRPLHQNALLRTLGAEQTSLVCLLDVFDLPVEPTLLELDDPAPPSLERPHNEEHAPPGHHAAQTAAALAHVVHQRPPHLEGLPHRPHLHIEDGTLRISHPPLPPLLRPPQLHTNKLLLRL